MECAPDHETFKELAEPSVINSLIIMTTLFYKIPPHLPLPVFDRKKITKGREITPLWQRGARGDFAVHVNSILRPLIIQNHCEEKNGDLVNKR